MKIFILIIVLIFFNKNLYSNNLFETSFYEVEFISKNIEDDKLKQINKIKKKSFLNILDQTLDSDEYNKIIDFISYDLINTLIKNVIINDEIIINNKYLSKIKINFNKKKIIDLYREKKISYVEYHPNQFLLIVDEEKKIDHNLFTKNNSFYLYLRNSDKYKIFKIPNLDINDRYILNKEDINKNKIDKIINFSKKYNLDDVIVVKAKTSEIPVNYKITLISNGSVLEKKLKANKIQLDDFFQILKFESLNIWKKINQIQNTSLNQINCIVKYYNMYELKEIKNNLSNISNIKSLNIKSLSYQKLEYFIYYYGNLNILKKVFELNHLKIIKNHNSCIIKLK